MVANTVGVLTAVLVGEIEPSVSSISIDKVTSYVIWSTTEPRDFTRDVPRHTAVLLACSGIKTLGPRKVGTSKLLETGHCAR